MINETYTGNFTFKQNVWGSLVLYIEMQRVTKFWRKATVEDLPYLKLKSDLKQNNNE